MQQKIYNYQLSNHKYEVDLLVENIQNLSLRKLLITQKLNYSFCQTYLLHPEEYAMCKEDYDISLEDIKIYQPHITNDK
jgi:hypothetical protein